ncbi:hypothetical protein [Bradyrhizobium barranii]
MSGKVSGAFKWIATEAKGLLLKEAFKYVFLTLVSLLLAWILTRLSQLLQLDTPLTPGTIGPETYGLLKDFIAHPYDNTIGVMTANPFAAVISLAFSIVVVLSAVLIRRAHLKVQSISAGLQEVAASAALASAVGIGGRWAHSAKDGSGAPWGELCKEILRAENNVLDILGANGLETFGEPSSPLYETLERFSGTTRIILLHPASQETAGRAMAVKMPVRIYRKAIVTSQSRLRSLRKSHHAVDGRFYDGQPNWKLIITSRTAWIQYYIPGGEHVAATPVYRFDASEDASCFYNLFHMEFDRIWRRCATTPMNL